MEGKLVDGRPIEIIFPHDTACELMGNKTFFLFVLFSFWNIKEYYPIIAITCVNNYGNIFTTNLKGVDLLEERGFRNNKEE